MKQISSLFLLLSLCAVSYCQTSISGIINQYASVLAIDSCNQSITVDQTDGFEPMTNILLVQMQGAEINTDNAASYGAIIDLKGAGYYERAVIVDVQGDQLILQNAPLNEYDLDGSVQLVSMPHYSSAIITDPLTAAEWDGSVGGILALSADTLEMLSDIDVSGIGFRGGTQELDYTGDCFWFINYNDYVYEASSIRSGYKGEGIRKIEDDIARGRGAQANGGGGGNDHNSGGGGGACLTSGGRGGDNDNPSTFGCQGGNPGRGGRPIGFNEGRIFMGGGGGAGHTNNAFSSSRADGGGIVVMDIGYLTANDFSVKANGENAPVTSGDGARGGGAGGTIVINAQNQDVSPLLLEARGGNGGNTSNNNSDQCFGPGGGGSGGFVLISTGLSFTSQLEGGQPGLTTNSSACGEGTNGAESGADGEMALLTSIPQSNIVHEVPVVTVEAEVVSVCELGMAILEAAITEGNYTLQWQIDMGSGYVDVTEGSVYQQVNTNMLLVSEVVSAMYSYTYRLEVVNDCGDVVYSDPIILEQYPAPVPDYTYTIDGLAITITNLSSFADTYQWFFGDGESSMELSPVHIYDEPGVYDITLIAENDCGETTIMQQVQIGAPPVPVILVDGNNVGCEPLQIQYINNSQGIYDSLEWVFPGGQPATSNEEMPIVVYETPGTYNATLTLFSDFPPASTITNQAVEVLPRPEPSFSYTIDGLTVSFTNNSTQADTYIWNFGDGENSNQLNPVHTYQAPGNYTVTLNASNANCNAAASQNLFLMINAVGEATDEQSVVLYPNPTDGIICVQSDWQWDTWKLWNMQGQLIKHGLRSDSNCLDFSVLPGSLYYIKLLNKKKEEWVGKILIE
ncbi:MAG: PKD domain-containing protein [Chitinophagales bacterium]|nr:PKD domain-containing protein [Chitinophagales bacterium]